MPDGTFVLFYTYGLCVPTGSLGQPSGVMAFQLDPVNMNANALFNFGLDSFSEHLGDVQRLPNGNYLATISEAGRYIEFSGSGEVVATLVARNGEVGYGEFRETLYGPPPY